MVDKAFISHFDNIMTQEKLFFHSLGYFTQKALSSHTAGESYKVGGMVCSDCCPMLCNLGKVAK